MENLTISSFNLRNHYWQTGWDGDDYPKILANFIKINHINFLGLQELVKKYSISLQKELGEEYTINGKYRYGHIPLIGQFNESNSIVSSQPIIKTETKYLARIPLIHTQMPRIMTSIETEEHFMVNTHIEYWNSPSQIYQLKVLYRYILQNKDKFPIITGDFNMDTTKEYFIEFIKELEKIGIYHINNSTPTYKTKEQILDHIFVSEAYEIENYEIIQNQPINEISDHRPIIAKIRKK